MGKDADEFRDSNPTDLPIREALERNAKRRLLLEVIHDISKSPHQRRDAVNALHVMYYTGECGPRGFNIEAEDQADDEVKWFQAAAEQGDPVAQYNLGKFCHRGHVSEQGTVVKKDYNQAFLWYQKAAQQEHYEAQQCVEAMQPFRCDGCQTQNEPGAYACVSCGERLPVECSKCQRFNTGEAKHCRFCGSPIVALEEKRRCRECGAENLEDALFCSSCGAALNACKECGEKNPATISFCSSCGAPLNVATAEHCEGEGGSEGGERDGESNEAFKNTENTCDNPREPISKRVRIFVWQRDQGRCVSCGSQNRLEFDHIIPIAEGGGNTERNIQLLCEPCNRSKGARL